MDKHKQLSRVTTREKEVINLLALGLTTKQIGQRLNISFSVPNSYLTGIIESKGSLKELTEEKKILL